MPDTHFDPDEIAGISTALAEGVANAEALVNSKNFGLDLHYAVHHAREMHDLLLEQMISTEPHVADHLRALCDAIGKSLPRLEELIKVDRQLPPHT